MEVLSIIISLNNIQISNLILLLNWYFKLEVFFVLAKDLKSLKIKLE